MKTRHMLGLCLALAPMACGSDEAAREETASEQPQPPASHEPLIVAADEVEALLTGRFDSSAQATLDPTYFPVQLMTCPIDAPELGERVLYVEQAVMSALDEPYRQRLYVVEPGEDPERDAISYVFELVAPDSFIGQCTGQQIPNVSANEAIARQGCRVELSVAGDHYAGTTPGTECLSDFSGATYATSAVELQANLIRSWDRGYDAVGQQVWGATAGPYEFTRRDGAATDDRR